MYTFLKIQFINWDEPLNNWYFKPKDIEQVKEHWDKYAMPELCKVYGITNKNPLGELGDLVESLLNKTNVNTQSAIKDLFLDKKEDRCQSYMENNDILLCMGGQILTIEPKLYKIVNQTEMDTLQYPQE
jgi:hypothetical protein